MMKTRDALLWTATTAFATGFLAGMLCTSESAREARRRLATTASDSSRWVGSQLQVIEQRLAELERQVQGMRHAWSSRVREATQGAVDHYVPSFPRDEESWNIAREDVAHDLRRMPRQ